MISGLRARDYEDRLQELGLTTLEERRHQADMAMVYKVLMGKEQVDPAEWFSGPAEHPQQARKARSEEKLFHSKSYGTVEPGPDRH